ncbi:conserved hypothetical protein [Paenibacillus curdlanolyticus YK9]|uniref:DUF4180 domain-containing protein n=1 Tax=Paenibacillus curdlanolyticus YK9 TaxID=717606 RepID=E0IA85_9BACL|nr:DUF4180 domain-containing protein [Paenibacillus curdlanolyticus]EFM10662.1 conserved hypothetical protein [Paenibacillus curdlanolyticus YK9]
MNITVNEKDGSRVAVISSDSLIIKNVDDALDLLADVHYNHGCDKMLVRKENIVEDFFELSTRLAGEILQKYTNYQMAIAIVGEFGSYNSKSLNDFIYECNQGKKIVFRSTEEEALEALHSID